ncbi:DNA replication/repair protein RecF [Anoxybacterium hadale]|uniref:DNA replication/repair protein RecF n=1 Tax=Anoxybacterium hadale TaxID=3408580 RepID=A0ACD1AEF7_9FIRM|nr:DNA replication/repair protein RecF [Clostridiales bacterium]
MYLKRIELKNFRNYEEAVVDFHKRVNIITGKNAQGKTNLLESLYIMSLGKSFRTSRDHDMMGFQKDFCKAKSISVKDDRELEIEIIISGDGKVTKINGVKTAKNIELLENVYMVVFSPEDLKIVKDEPEKRRKFIDRELCQLKPVYYRNLGRYKKILQQRNSLLKQQDLREDIIAVWDESLAEYGAKVIQERKKFIEKLNRISKEISLGITGGKEALEISYEGNVEILGNYDDQRELFRKVLHKNVKQDFARRTTLSGPHKDDLKLCVEGVDIRHFGSQGQQRTAALSLKLAEIRLIEEETGVSPILLLDDVLSELDGDRQNYLINSLSDVQLFITTAELNEDVKRRLPEGDTFLVESGRVEKLKQ